MQVDAFPEVGIRVCAGLPTWGAAVEQHGLAKLVSMARAAGVDGLWVGDHVALARDDGSVYPGRSSGQFFMAPETSWYEAMTALGYVAAHAGELDLGVGVALPVLRPPVLFAKQVATLSRLTGGSLTLGVGTGWLRSEYEAVGVPWSERGSRLDACVEVMRACWTGEPPAGTYGHYTIPPRLTCYPTPRSSVPILVGGASAAAFRRAARLGDGWIAAAQDWEGAVEALQDQLGQFRRIWEEQALTPGRDPHLAVVMPVPSRIVRGQDFPSVLHERIDSLVRLGFTTIVAGFSWDRLPQTQSVLEGLVEASRRLRAR